MQMINIRKTSDTFERYKMPRLLAKVEGRGNGIKTVIVNMVDIAKALKRPPLYPTKYFGCELGAQIQVDTKNDRYIVNGSHQADRLQDLLYAFIEKYVLCGGCGNPETKLHINSKKQIITASCIACGHSGQVEAVSRFSSFLIKHPPDQTDSPVVSKKGKGRRNKGEQNGNDNENGNGNGNFASQDSGEHDDDDDDWFDDTEEEQRRRNEEQQLSDRVRNLIMSDEAEKPEEERLNIFYSYCNNLKEKNQFLMQAKSIFDRAEALNIKDKAPLLLMDLMVSLKTFQRDINEVKAVLQLFTYGNVRAQRNLLGGVEKLVADLSDNEIAQFVPSLLQVLYMSDVVEDQGFHEWSKRASSRYVGSASSKRIHAAAKPFMDWLEDAEEEESDEEPESEELEESDLHVDFSHNASKVGVIETVKNEGSEDKNDEALDDLDIDNI